MGAPIVQRDRNSCQRPEEHESLSEYSTLQQRPLQLVGKRNHVPFVLHEGRIAVRHLARCSARGADQTGWRKAHPATLPGKTLPRLSSGKWTSEIDKLALT